MARLRLKEIMDERGITQTKLVEDIKISRTTVSKYYHNYGTQFDFLQLQKFADYLGVSIHELIVDDEPQAEPTSK